MEHNVSILIITCSLYENIWEPFFKCLKNKWPDNKYKIYIGCDKYVDKSKYPGKNFIITNIEPYSSNYNNRVKDFLKQIKTKYVLLFQDDLLITSQIKTNDIINCLNVLEKNKEYNGIRLHSIGADSGKGNKIFKLHTNKFLRNMSYNQKYWFSWMVTLWNREKLSIILDNLKKDTSAEDCEIELTKIMKKKNKSMLSIGSGKSNIIDYMGIGAINGGILNNKYMEYLKKENVPIKVYDNNCIYDKNNPNLHKYNKTDNYYMKNQNRLIKKSIKYK